MKWLLISSYGNPGDTFIRMGVEQLVVKVDPSAEFHILYKEIAEDWQRLLLNPDKIIWCGMPFLWSFPTHSSQTIFWRESLLQKLYERKNDFLILGAGTAGLCAETKEKAFSNVDEITRTLDEALEGSFNLTMRDDCMDIYGIRSGLTVLPCPAVFTHEQSIPEHTDLICNFMLNGGHYPELSPEISDLWNKELAVFAVDLLMDGASFAAHSQAEVELASLHGFDATYSGPNKLLGQLSGAKRYIGNRVHGAIVAAGAGADSTCCGFDLRIRAAEISGAKVTYFNCHMLPEARKYGYAESKKAYIEILEKFVGGER